MRLRGDSRGPSFLVMSCYDAIQKFNLILASVRFFSTRPMERSMTRNPLERGIKIVHSYSMERRIRWNKYSNGLQRF